MSTITAKLELPRDVLQATDTESTRYSLSAVQVEPASGGAGTRLVATNGRIMAVRETRGEAETPVLIPREAFGQKAPKKRERRVAELNGKWRSGNQGTHLTELDVPEDACETHAMPEGRFPKWRDVIPHFGDDCVIFAVNTELLAKLATAIGSADGCVTLCIPTTEGYGNQPIGVLPHEASEASLGVLMPLSAGDSLPGKCRSEAIRRMNDRADMMRR